MSLRPANYEDAKRSYKPMRRTPLRSRTSLKQGTKRLKAGKKTNAWNNARAIIKRRFEKVGITRCELRGSDKVPHDCGNDNYLGFAHDAKRRKLTAEDLYRVILICNFAHDIIEALPPEEMKAIVDDTIQLREVQL